MTEAIVRRDVVRFRLCCDSLMGWMRGVREKSRMISTEALSFREGGGVFYLAGNTEEAGFVGRAELLFWLGVSMLIMLILRKEYIKGKR